MFQKLFTGCLALLLIGCASVGRKIAQEEVDKIQKGRTTRAQVDQLLGSPDHVTKDGDGNVTYEYVYAYAQAKGESFIPVYGAFAGGTKVQSQTVRVTFGPDGIV